jgi:Domain of unknown function (DUF2804), N-terminal/Domain of unknown function (DUF2804), C-terminal
MHNYLRPVKEKEITRPVQLCDDHGILNPAAVGWSREPFTNCNLSGHPLRKKRWNYWAITTPDFLFSITISNVDYLGMVFAYFLDFKTRRFIEKTLSPLLGKGCNMPEGVYDPVSYTDPALSASFISKQGKTRILVDSPDFGGVKLNADFEIQQPKKHETMSVVIPWTRNVFQYTSKHNCLPASGFIKLDDTTYQAKKGDAYACLDYGRGIWPYSSSWNWSSFSGKSNGHVVGVNLGGLWTDGTGLTENSITCDGIITKLSEDVVFQYDTTDFMKPWSIATRDTRRVKLTFTPFYERVAVTNALILKSSVHQMFGSFEGTITPEGEKPVKVHNLIGWAEEHHALW